MTDDPYGRAYMVAALRADGIIDRVYDFEREVTRRPKASDIPDMHMLVAIQAATGEHVGSAMLWDLERVMSHHPPKVVRAKLRRVIGRSLVTGCPCGCRGEFALTEAGLALLTDAARN